MGRILLICRLAARDLRRRPAQAVLLLLAIAAAATTLTLGLALHGVTSQPYGQTRAATNGPDVVAQLSSAAVRHRPGQENPGPQILAKVNALVHASGVTGHSGPYPLAGVVVRARGLTAGVEVEGRSQAPASLDQPKVTAGGWVRGGGVVLERTFAEALGVGVGDRITLNGRPFQIAGIAVTAAMPPYPNLCYSPGGGCSAPFPDTPSSTNAQLGSGALGLAWATQPDTRVLASSDAGPPAYVLNLKLKDPARAQAFASAYDQAHQAPGASFLNSGPGIQAADGLLVQDEQSVLSPGAWLACLLAVASVAVLAGGRMAEHTRRVGLLKAVGGAPGLVAAVLLAENLALALVAAAAGLAVAHAAHRRAGGGGGASGGPGRDAGARHPRRPHQHGQRAGQRGPPAAAPGRPDRGLGAAAGAAALGAPDGRPPAAARPAGRGQHRGHQQWDRRRAGLPRHRRPETLRRVFRAE
jgi:putative ABC transport system permease protein